ncbi:hypothetical protein BDR06DRAFT_443970 [Suillus hirtellus]|nr:hypothetical protein BDR06DRAFT_443970 [Suillus hirtellus]
MVTLSVLHGHLFSGKSNFRSSLLSTKFPDINLSSLLPARCFSRCAIHNPMRMQLTGHLRNYPSRLAPRTIIDYMILLCLHPTSPP